MPSYAHANRNLRTRRQCWRSTVGSPVTSDRPDCTVGIAINGGALLAPLASLARVQSAACVSPALGQRRRWANGSDNFALFFKWLRPINCAATVSGVEASGVQRSVAPACAVQRRDREAPRERVLFRSALPTAPVRSLSIQTSSRQRLAKNHGSSIREPSLCVQGGEAAAG